MPEPLESMPQAAGEEPFLKRWSRLKQAVDAAPGQEAEASQPGMMDEAARLALRALLHGSEFNRGDGLNEYDGDYTAFSPRGDVPTQDMVRAVERLTETADASPPGGGSDAAENAPDSPPVPPAGA